ncbi:BrnT family toxin [Hoeflea sp.]|uniref:BrnT family toxin n=1 Tax=Hoeflea sp. TaxID=1940281 RepID=UPI0019899142|nr:BrnT family toxin [Hoeflea sp.]MBC7284485.1 BrnT family toxin [Hoeflea sp.]
MNGSIAGFDWDAHNSGKCQKHGVTLAEVEALFEDGLAVLPDIAHSATEERFKGIGRTRAGRHVFVVFTLRVIDGARLIRPISARYMHDKEVRHYEEENP